ncbi:concanavalin A-like lectin/glucanase domain-containing protein [Tricladium varicosporioides]|nr:concanavalin A-like lectin/glucanase domain-containing protein [Hymenoscyphus varicosporioides]
MVRTNHPIPLQNTSFYFEITILDSGENGRIGLGLCSGYAPLDSFPGWSSSSWGYHGDDGNFHSEGTRATYGNTFGTGDVIGCYIGFDKGITFTKNGTSLGKAADNISGKLYPAVGMESRGACIRVNFDPKDF